MKSDKIISFFDRHNLNTETTIKWLIIGLLSGTVITLTQSLFALLRFYLLIHLSDKALLAVIKLESLALVGALTFLVLFFISNQKLKKELNHLSKSPPFIKKYGLLWDKDGNPHCPSHQILIRRGDPSSATEWFVCPNCTTKNSSIYITDENGQDIPFAVARQKVLASYKT